MAAKSNPVETPEAGVEAIDEYQRLLDQGFYTLRFPDRLESVYRQARAEQRRLQLNAGSVLVILISNGLLLSDYLMIPDQFHLAVILRLFIFTPIAMMAALLSRSLGAQVLEAFDVIKTVSLAGITAILCLASQDHLAGPYLVSLALLVMFNGSVIRMSFWKALLINACILALGFATWHGLHQAPNAIMIPVMLVMVATTVFSLYGNYMLELEERRHWLMRRQERGLLDELGQANRHLDHISRSDLLTGIANRRHFDEHLAQTWSRAARDGQKVALLMIDIDHFKAYNDRYGHLVGDACLKEVASKLQNALRKPGSMIARFGGEEFIVLLTHTTLNHAISTAQRLRSAVQDMNILHEASPTSPCVTVSIGVAYLNPADGFSDPTQLMTAADLALYEAKSSGRNKVHAMDDFDPRMQGSYTPAPRSPLAEELFGNAHSAWTGLSDAAQKLALQRLHFPAPFEAQFLNEGFERRLSYTVYSGLLALLIFNGFLIVDYLMTPDVFWLALKVRVGLFTPVALAVLGSVFFGREYFLKHLTPHFHEGIVLLSGVLAASCLLVVLVLSHNPMAQFYSVGYTVIVIYGNLVQRLRFWYALTFSALVFALHMVGVLAAPVYDPRLVIPISLLVLATMVYSLLSNYALEQDERRNFLLAVRQKQLLIDIKEVHWRLEKISRIDALTGVYNRRHFQECLQQICQRARGDGSEVSIIMLDVDHFKKYNDSYGHPAGDECLKKVALAMCLSLRRPDDVVARFGGEEFIAVLPQTGAQLAEQAAKRIQEAVLALKIQHRGSPSLAVVSASLGVASARIADEACGQELIAQADAALYAAKQHGRNRVACADDFAADSAWPSSATL